MNVRPSRRPALGLAALVTIALGLGVRAVGDGIASAVGGDALYAVLVYVVVALVAPRARPLVVAAVAWGVCAAVELAQLAGFSAAVVGAWEPARWVLGTTFHGPDLVVYAAGAVIAGALDTVLCTASRRRERLSGRAGPAASGSRSGRRDRRPTPGRPSSPS